jgi:hypothetical protein
MKDSKLKLLNTKVGILQDSRNSWPEDLELNGFTYDRLGNFISDNGNDLANRNISWFIEWMGKQKKYSPQPYEHLAKILRQDGRKKEAREILFAGKSREHSESRWGAYIWLSLLWIFIGYGYYIYCALYWALGLVFMGTLVLRWFSKHKLRFWGLAYSIDMLLPIIQLRKYHYDSIELEGWVRVYFYGHKMFGYILALFIITGLTGIVK